MTKGIFDPAVLKKAFNGWLACTLLLLMGCNGEPESSKTDEQKQQKAETPDTKAIQAGSMDKFDKNSIASVFDQPVHQKAGFFKITFPRSDLDVTLNGYRLKPGFSHTSWMSFLPLSNGEAKMMGDMVLKDEELKQVLPELRARNIQVTAIHNHLAAEHPPLKYMHIAAEGDPEKIAAKMKAVLNQTAVPLKQGGNSKETPNETNWEPVQSVLGKEGNESGALLKFAFPRKETIQMKPVDLPKTFGVHTAINFQGIGPDSAIITGDFVMRPDEVNPIMQTLTKNNITTTALHNHMLHEDPRLFYMHFWAAGKAKNLAKGLKEALKKGAYEGFE